MPSDPSASLELAQITTRGRAQHAITRAFAAAGLETPDLDARQLLAGILSIELTELILRPGLPLGSAARAVGDAVSRRLTGEPVSRILGYRAFYGHDFEINSTTLDPRADSETLIEAALSAIESEGWRDRPMKVLDVGTGSGCLLITLLIALPQARGFGTDISAAALDVAQRNAAKLGVQGRVAWQIADALGGVEGPFDLIVSNPPYIPSADIAGLQRDVRAFDPLVALDGGADGLAVYRSIIDSITNDISKGYVVFEVGYNQADAVAGLLKTRGWNLEWQPPVITHDLAGHARCVTQRTLR